LAFATSACAVDPILMFLVSIAKEAIGAPKPSGAPAPEVAPSTVYPGTNVEPAILRRLINDSFLHLTTEQRDEVFQALHAELIKPGNFAVRAPIIEHFTYKALQVRAAHMQLARLSSAQKQALAAGFRLEAKTLPEEELAPLREALEKGILPVPADLNQLLLAALQ